MAVGVRPTSNPFSQKPQLFSTMLYSLVPIIGLAAVVLFSFWMWRHHKLAYPAALVPTHFLIGLNQPWPFLLCAAEGQSDSQPERTHCTESLRLDNCFAFKVV
ncbi:hypothetical protein PAMP_016646 [Pampus punctatissimus]